MKVTKQELSETSCKLEETEKTLEKTKNRLAKTMRQRDEQSHLVSTHKEAETNLLQQANQVGYAESLIIFCSIFHACYERNKIVLIRKCYHENMY